MGTMIDTKIQFEEIKPIGNNEGLNSNVFLARDVQLGTELVIKKISKESLSKQNLNIDEYFLEAKALYASKSPYVMEIQYASQDKQNIYLAMPFLRTGSLNSKMDSTFLTVREIIKYSVDILTGLNVIHSKNLIHLDIKPTNILIDDSGKAIITDFGLSRFLDKEGFAEQYFNYNLHRDPESFTYSKRSIYSDIYQFGMTLYRMCNGNNVLKIQAQKLGVNSTNIARLVTSGKFPKRKNYLPHIPRKLQMIVEKCINVDVCKRYSNALEIMNDINSINENLDWRFCPSSNYVYEKQCDNNKKILVRIENQGESYNIVCIRTDENGNTTRKINKYCINNIQGYEKLKIQLINIFNDIN